MTGATHLAAVFCQAVIGVRARCDALPAREVKDGSKTGLARRKNNSSPKRS